MKHFAFIALSIGLLACGKQSDSLDETGTLPLESEDAYETYLGNFSLSNDTPEAVGGLLTKNSSYDESWMKTCTWFLVDKNIAMTNSHCIPDILKLSSRTNCAPLMQGLIQTSNGVPVARSCKKVLFFSAEDLENQKADYALVELNKPVDATPLPVSRAGMGIGETFSVLSIDFTSSFNAIYGAFRKQECVTRSSRLRKSNNPKTVVIPIFNRENQTSECRLIPGNSGSAVIHSQSGEVRGIAFATNLDIDSTALRRQHPELEQSGQLKNYGVATNLACLNLVQKNLNLNLSPECSSFLNTGSQQEEEASKKEILDKYELVL